MSPRKKKITPERLELFKRNFDRETYEKVRDDVLARINKSHSFPELWKNLRGLDHDVEEYLDDCTIIWCDVELDRSRMETDADYVGVGFLIRLDDEKCIGELGEVGVFSNEPSRAEIADCLCAIHPYTCEITNWIY